MTSPLPDRPLSGDLSSSLDLLDLVLGVAPEREAYVHGDRRVTFAEWAAAADGLAGQLAELGVGKGDVVCLQLPSSVDYAVCYQAAQRLGAVTSGINPRLGAGEVASIVARSRPTVTVRDEAIDAPVPDGAGHVLARSELASVGPGDPSRRRIDVESTDPVAIVWTSGTTGVPKGAVFDHGCLAAMADGAAPLSQVGDRRLSPLPFAHVGYMTRVWDELSHLITTVVTPTPWSAGEALRLIQAERVTVGQGVPAQWRLVLDHPDFPTTDVSSLRIAGTGASRVPPELVREMQERLRCPVVVRYASTEASLATGTRMGDPVEVIATTVGRPNGGVEVRVTDDGGHDVVNGEVGTVRLRSRAMMRGYWGDPDGTAQAIDGAGWLVTGDLGWLGDDGNLRVVGRRDEMYIRGGYNVYPAEVENVLGEHPGVAEAAVVAAPAEVLGEIGVAFVVPATGERAPSLDELRVLVKERLADYKAPDRLALVDRLPLTSMGKTDKQALRPRAEEEAATWAR